MGFLIMGVIGYIVKLSKFFEISLFCSQGDLLQEKKRPAILCFQTKVGS